MRKRKTSYNWYKLLMCGLVFFVIGGTAFCMAAESKESAEKKARIEAELAAEAAEAEKAAERAVEKAAEEAERARKESFSVKPGVPAGTLDPDLNEKSE